MRPIPAPARCKLLAAALYLLWAGSWFRAFTLFYGSHFFRHHLVSRSLALAAAMSVILLCPPIAVRQFLEFRRQSITWSEALFRCALWTSALWVGFWLLFIAMIKTHLLAGDDAMGAGIHLVLCFVALLAVNAALAVAMLLSHRRE